MTKKKFIEFLNSRIGRVILFSFTFIFLFTLVLNNVGLTLREKIPIGATLDFSWFFDSIERMLHGYVLGRDFTFTYGPLFQLIYSLPSLIFHVPSYISLAISPLVSFIFIFFLVLIIAKYITKNFFEQIAYVLFLFIILGLLNSNTDIIRFLAPLTYSLILFDLFRKKASWIKYFIVAFLPTFFGLYSYNLFVITLLFTLLFFVITLFKSTKNKSKNLQLLLFIPCILVLHVLFSLLLTHNFDYIFYSLDSVNNYKYLMGLPWTHDRSNIMLIFPVALVFFGIYLTKIKYVSEPTRRMLLILILSSFVGLISALSRSDAAHLQLGIYPSMITFFTIIFVLSKANRGLILIAFIFYLLVPFKPTFYNTFAPKNILKVFHTIVEKPSFFTVYNLPDNYYSEKEVKDIAEIARKNKNQVYVYPYDSFVLNLEGSTFNSFALGLYTYSNSPVEENMVNKFKINPPPIIILEVDTKGAFNLDEIPNFTRNPLLARWIIKNYIVNQEKSKYLVLSFAPDKKTTPSDKCLAYELSVNLASKENFLQKIIDVIKPATYYLDKIRLPYSLSAKNYLVFNDVFTSSGLASLFGGVESTSAKTNILDKSGNLDITRVSAFLSKKENKIYSKNEFSLKCANLNN